MKERNFVCRAKRLLLVKRCDNKKVKSPYNWVISPLTQPQVANQQKKISLRKVQTANANANFPDFFTVLLQIECNLCKTMF